MTAAWLPRTVVGRTAMFCGLGTALFLSVAFTILFCLQKNTLKNRLILDVTENLVQVCNFTIGYFYAQNNWMQLEAMQKQLNRSPNVLYSYIVNAEGKTDFHMDGLIASADPSTKTPWEPDLQTDTQKVVIEHFRANGEFAERFPRRVRLGDEIVLIGAPIYCAAIGEKCAQLRVAVAFESIQPTLSGLQKDLIVLLIILTGGVGFAIFFWTRRTLDPLRTLTREIHEVAQLNPQNHGGLTSLAQIRFTRVEGELDSGPEEIRYLSAAFKKFVDSIERSVRLENELAVTSHLSDLASQVAHDIRSPLTALSMVSDDLSQLPVAQKQLLKSAVARINDIANTLLRRSKETIRQSSQRDEEVSAPQEANVDHVVCTVDSLVSEKRVQYRNRSRIRIETRFDPSSYEGFITMPPLALKRILSNLIDNAIESIETEGLIAITVTRLNHHLHVGIADNGKGIDSEILPRLMHKGATFGKENGSGLGLYHARTTIESLGGNLRIGSTLGKGTVVTMLLPSRKSPPWFVSSVNLCGISRVVVVDDDPSIHDLWRQRIGTLDEGRTLDILHIASGQALAEWWSGQPASEETLFLIDFEFIGEKMTGLDHIVELRIQTCSILVTSRFEEYNLKQECANKGVPLIPKNLALHVPVITHRSVRDDCVGRSVVLSD